LSESAGPRRVLITGIGLVTPLGETLAAFSQALSCGHSGFAAVKSSHSDEVPGARVHSDLTEGLTRSELMLADRSTQLALRAAALALRDAGWDADDPEWERCGLFVGSGSGPTEAVHTAHASLHSSGRMAGTSLLRCLPSGAASAIAIRHHLRGQTQTYTSACASSAQAIGEAMRAIRHGYIDVALVGGTEAPFGGSTIKAWEAMRVLAPMGDNIAQACRPFDRSRRGIVLGEGAAFFVLESQARARSRGVHQLAHAQLAGYGAAGDGHHWTEPNAGGQAQAMFEAIHDAGLQPQDIGAINAHGTGTAVGDQVEARSIGSLFESKRRNDASAPWVSSTKGHHGHLLGASGAIEMAAAIATLKTGNVPATRNLNEADAENTLRLVRGKPARLREGSAVLSNSFAFGGSNACLVLKAA
jgi:3-oxoacyl-[acyl-carrier-protein] synthase II